jgi:oligopeptide/dipeptide ABC transporter ATP-binding protein
MDQKQAEAPVGSGDGAALLRVEGLRVGFGGREAVRGISFAIAPAETLGLVGESGSGKSATSLAVLRLLPPEAEVSGRIWFARNGDGGRSARDWDPADDLLALPEREMRARRGREIAMIFQEPMTALNPLMRVGEQIAEAVRAHHPGLRRAQVRERVLDAMAEVALPEPERRWRDYPHQFSGGMRQRVMIAMALSAEPELLVADEPTTALDVTIQAQILQLMRDLKTRHGTAILLITHDLGVIAEVADRVAVMYAGNIVEVAPVRDLYGHPLHPYAQGLLNSIPRMDQPDKKLESIPGSVPNLIYPPSGCRFHPRCPHAMPICKEKRPPMTVEGEGHTVACFLFNGPLAQG